ncbi:MAG: type II secretion system F family protein [Alphaproteobacteria bacterium]|nr:type II secretion system F family protein [Alphaproteobacteria bacterium]MBV9374583.1 type II secretion system F family protein [Alphaproteobacteria bacterium]
MSGTDNLFETIAGYLTIRLGKVSLSPGDTVILVVTLAAALLCAFYLWRIGRQEDRRDRLMELRGPVVDRTVREQRPRWYQRIGTMVAASPAVGTAEQQRLLGVLAAAGIRGQGSLSGFVASKLCSAFIVGALFWLLLEWSQFFDGTATIRFAVVLAGMMLGWRLPDFVLSRLAARRRLEVELGLPDALDLLVICAEAGLSLDQAIEQVGVDLRTSSPAVADEFAMTASEMRVLPNRAEALENLIGRTGVPGLRSITATLNQTIRFGTPLAESLRVLAAEIRNARLLRIEERAARLPVLLTIPLALFILPALMMVVSTPTVLRLSDTMQTNLGAF